jgi:hypothetical protein
MSSKWFVCLLLGVLAWAQATSQSAQPTANPSAAPAPAAAPSPDKPAEAQVAPTDPVITVKGVCADAAKTPDSCQTVVTREQFEKLADALQPNMPPQVRRQLATAYSRMLIMSTAAEKRGLDKQPKYDETLRFARMQILSQQLSRDLQEESQKVPDADMEKYYKDNAASYEEATLLRIFVPKNKQMPVPKAPVAAASKAGAAGAAKAAAPAKPVDPAAQEKAGQAIMTKEAADLRARAVKGEDFDKLQKEAFVAAGLKTSAPPSKMEKVRQTTLPPTHKPVLELNAGEVSAVIDDPSGHYIYKLVSKKTLTLDEVKTEIRNTLATQRYRDAMQGFQTAPDLNQTYFAAPKPPAMPPMRPGQPPSKGEDDSD